MNKYFNTIVIWALFHGFNDCRNLIELWSDNSDLFETTFFAKYNYSQCDQKKSPNVYKSCPKMVSLEKWKILNTFTKIA